MPRENVQILGLRNETVISSKIHADNFQRRLVNHQVEVLRRSLHIFLPLDGRIHCVCKCIKDSIYRSDRFFVSKCKWPGLADSNKRCRSILSCGFARVSNINIVSASEFRLRSAKVTRAESAAKAIYSQRDNLWHVAGMVDNHPCLRPLAMFSWTQFVFDN